MRPTLRLNARVLPAIALLALAMQIIDPSRAWMILFVGMGGAWLICRWWARGLARSLHFEREMRFGWAQVGDRLEERFTLTNGFLLPATWVALHDHSTLPDHYGSVATGVEGASFSQWTLKTQCTRRGVYTLGGTTLETGDPLGMYTVTLQDPTSTTLAVMPPIVSLPHFHIVPGGWAGEGRPGRHALLETINTSHPREMQPHDPVRLIHWKTTAHRSAPGAGAGWSSQFFVRQFEGSPAGDWWIVLDLDRSVQAGAGWDSTEEHGVILAASLGARGLEQEHPVGLSTNGTAGGWIAPRRNEYQLRSLLKALAVATPGDLPLQAYLQRVGPALSSHCSLVIVTANAGVEWPQALMPLMWRGVMPTVFLHDPLTFGGSVETGALVGLLRSMHVPCHVIPREFLDTSQARPGHEGEWEWRVSATGKAVAVRTAHEDWRGLA